MTYPRFEFDVSAFPDEEVKILSTSRILARFGESRYLELSFDGGGLLIRTMLDKRTKRLTVEPVVSNAIIVRADD